MRKHFSVLVLRGLLTIGSATALAASPYENEETLDAPLGELAGVEFKSLSQGQLRIAARFLELREGSAWSPCIFVGLRSPSRQDQFRLFYMQHKKSDKGLVMGYEYYEDGKNIKRTALVTKIPKTEEIELEMSWGSGGQVHFKDALGREQSFATRFKAGVPYIQACSAKANVRWSIYQ